MNEMKNELNHWVNILELCEIIEKKYKNKKSAQANKKAQKALKEYISLMGTEFGD